MKGLPNLDYLSMMINNDVDTLIDIMGHATTIQEKLNKSMNAFVTDNKENKDIIQRLQESIKCLASTTEEFANARTKKKQGGALRTMRLEFEKLRDLGVPLPEEEISKMKRKCERLYNSL